MTRFDDFMAETRAAAEQAGLEVWDDVPAAMPTVGLPEGARPADLCAAAVRLGAGIIYVWRDAPDDEATVATAGFAYHGIFHSLLVSDLVESLADDDEDDEDGSWMAMLDEDDSGYADLRPKLQGLVDVLVAHEDYDPMEHSVTSQLLEEVCGSLSDDDFERVSDVAESRFFAELEDRIETAAERLAARLLKDDTFDPLVPRDVLTQWVASKRSDAPRRVVRRAVGGLRRLAFDSGLMERAEEALEAEATELLDSLPADVRDRLGFSSRVAVRTALLEPYLGAYPEHRHDRLTSLLYRIEVDEHGPAREQRYATAAALLMDTHGETKTSAGRILGLSSSVIERIRRENPKRVPIAGDEVLSTLDPRLR